MPILPQGVDRLSTHQHSQKYPRDELLLPGDSIFPYAFVLKQYHREQTKHQGSKKVQRKMDADSTAKKL